MQGKNFIRYYWLCCLFIAFAGCENDPAEVEAMMRTKEDVEVARNVNAIFSQTGDIRATLEAPLMLRIKGDTNYAEFPESILVHFYKDSLTLESIVKAKYAKYLELLGKVYMRDSVVIYNMTGDTLYANDLWWDQNLQIFFTDDSVRIRTLTQKLRGTGFWSKADFKDQIIYNPVGEVDLPPDFKE